jgi:hypothetical protein
MKIERQQAHQVMHEQTSKKFASKCSESCVNSHQEYWPIKRLDKCSSSKPWLIASSFSRLYTLGFQLVSVQLYVLRHEKFSRYEKPGLGGTLLICQAMPQRRWFCCWLNFVCRNVRSKVAQPRYGHGIAITPNAANCQTPSDRSKCCTHVLVGKK